MDVADIPLAVQDDLRDIDTNARRAADLTRQLLAFSRQQILQTRVIDLCDVVRSMMLVLQRLTRSPVSISCGGSPDQWCVRADRYEIERVIINLVMNAEHAMPSVGGVNIRVENATIDDTFGEAFDYAVTPGEYVLLSVEDTGTGMDAETKARIFEPFFTTKQQGQGTGLGLATVYGVVKQSGGYIWVDSEPGTGTAFRIYLPAVQETPAPVVNMDDIADETNVHGCTIMVCEDEQPVRTLVKRVLEMKGYRVLTAGHPREALAIAETYGERIDLIITDIVMPGMGGRELLRQVQVLRPGIRCILMSGYSESDLAWNAGGRDALPFLQKPFTPASLSSIVAAVLEKPESEVSAE